MQQNMGNLDRTLRLVFVAMVASAYALELIGGGLALTLTILAIIFALTSAVGFCPLYRIFGLNTGSSR